MSRRVMASTRNRHQQGSNSSGPHTDSPATILPQSYQNSNPQGTISMLTGTFAMKRRDEGANISPTTSYYAQRMIGSGTFGTVYIAKAKGSDETVAIKRYIYDRKYRNREVHIMQQITSSNGGKGHPHILKLITHFTAGAATKGSKSEELYLNLVLEYVPETLHTVQKHYAKRRQGIPDLLVKIYTFQMLRALAHIHGMGIAHRDIKPQNLLVDPTKFILKLCDFGSAKLLIKGEANVAYICSRFYRAPELILGNTEYSTLIDVWSAGCVFAEMMLGTPVFPGMSCADQLIEIVKVLGTPSVEQILAMNPAGVSNHVTSAESGNGEPIRIPPSIPSKNWKDILPSRCTGPANVHTIAFLEQLLKYSPAQRMKAIDACAHVYFHEVRDPTYKLPDGSISAFDSLAFTQEELSLASFETVRILTDSTKRRHSVGSGMTGISAPKKSHSLLVKAIHGNHKEEQKITKPKQDAVCRVATMSETSSDGEASSSDEE
jgi:serine/threonine protein kinase